MAKIALVFSYNENWIGGTYYIMGLIHALLKLPESQQPEIFLFCEKKSDKIHIDALKYKYLCYCNYNVHYTLPERIVNRLFRIFTAKNKIDHRPDNTTYNAVFPNPHGNYFDHCVDKIIYWIPDMQDKIYPDYFTEEQLKFRDGWYSKLAASEKKIIFSSKNAGDDFDRYYPNNILKKYVVNFATFHPDYQDISIDTLKEKFRINKQFFIIPNQFWKHKNHKVVLEAIALLKNKGLDCQFVFTGKQEDYRNPNHYAELMKFVGDNDIKHCTLFLGFIERTEQLRLIHEAIAVIQPSLFEGWSTVVEDAKVMSQFVILSDIPVHREQIAKNVDFFNPHDAMELSKKIKKYIECSPVKETIPYDDNILSFANNFMRILDL